MTLSLSDYLQKHSQLPLSLIWHANRTSYLSCRMTQQRMVLRLHRMFESMPMSIWESLVLYIFQKDKRAKAVLKKAAYAYFCSVYQPSKPLEAVGSVHNLLFLYDKVKSEYFPSLDQKITIGWSKKRNGPRGRCVTFGSYDPHHYQIRIHPCLDHSWVPSYFLEFVIYHEILHAACPPKISSTGRIYAHSAEFRQREKLFIDYAKAKSFQKRFCFFM